MLGEGFYFLYIYIERKSTRPVKISKEYSQFDKQREQEIQHLIKEWSCPFGASAN